MVVVTSSGVGRGFVGLGECGGCCYMEIRLIETLHSWCSDLCLKSACSGAAKLAYIYMPSV